MRARMVVYASLLLALALSPLAAIGAQQDKSTTKPSTTAKVSSSSGSLKLTGCIKEGSAADQYIMKAADGKTYQLSGQGPDLDLSWRVGSKVTITGAAAASDPTHVTVKSLDVIETYCP